MILTVRMDTLQILKMLQSDSFTKSVFTSVLPSDRLPDIVLERPKGYIVNVDGSDKPGSHWVAMFFPTTPDGEGDGAAEFMDPLREKPNYYSEHFKTFLQNNSSSYIYNKHVLQSPWSSVCGQYCLFYALHRCRNIPMSTITNMFTNDKEWNDMLVRDFIRKWFFVQ